MRFTLQRGGRTALVDTLGGELTSYRDETGREYIWQGDAASWAGRNPILFPIVGKLKNDTASALGKSCHMPQHGLARKREFTLAQQGEGFVVLEQREDAATLEQFPFPYLLRVRQELVDNGFVTMITVQNPGPEDLPFCLGAHTGFRCPLDAGERFEDYELVFDRMEDLPAILPSARGLLDRKKTLPCLVETDTLPLDYAVFDAVDTLVFDGLRSHGVSLRHREGGHGVHVAFPDFPMVAFWTMPHARAPFLCIEPWHGSADYEDCDGIFEHKPYVISLAPGERWSAGYRVTTL